jgi:uncharacterized protein YndB with AHSA1/START domain
MSTVLPAVRRSVTVGATPERAFQVYVESFGTWWPREYHIGTSDMVDAVIEPRAGGRWYEKCADGSECDWGQVVAYEPPGRLVLTWQIGADWQYVPDPAKGSEVEVRFTAEGPDRTRVEIEHRHFERHGDGAAGVHEGIAGEGGWTFVLAAYEKAMG